MSPLYELKLYKFAVELWGNGIKCFYSCDQRLCKFFGTKERVDLKKKFNSQKTGLEHQYGWRDVTFHIGVSKWSYVSHNWIGMDDVKCWNLMWEFYYVFLKKVCINVKRLTYPTVDKLRWQSSFPSKIFRKVCTSQNSDPRSCSRGPTYRRYLVNADHSNILLIKKGC